MHITCDVQYTMQVTPQELNVIGLALCGRLKEEQRAEALELNRSLLEQKTAAHMRHVNLAGKALKSLEEN